MLMNLETLDWDYRLLKFFRISHKMLPIIKSCSEIYGYIFAGPLIGVPIASSIGDQQGNNYLTFLLVDTV
jgi:glycerol kinase